MNLAGHEFELTRPIWTLALLALPVLFFWFRRSLVDFARWQKRLSLCVRGLVVGLIVLALAGLTLLEPTSRLFVVFAVDRSLSVGEDSRKVADEFITAALATRGDHLAAVMTFGEEPGAVSVDLEGEPVDPPDGGTDIAAALEVAGAAIPPFHLRKIVLLSDGNETRGDALHSALGLRQMRISTVPLPVREDPEVQVSSVEVPAQIRQGEPFWVEVVINSNHEDEGTVEIYRGPHKIVEERKKLEKGETRFKFRQTVTRERLAEYTVRTRGFEDTLLDNNAETGLVFASGKPRVLLIESTPKLAKHLQWALNEEDIKVDVRPPQGMPTTLADLQNYELLIISNVPATSLTLKQMELTRTWVQDLGGGLVMIGGDQSFGLGGYYKTLIEEILPVRSNFEKQKEKPSLGMVLVIDKSGSMGGQKIELAKDAAKAAVELLGARDKVGVIAFDGRSYWVSDVTPCADRGAVLDAISGIESGGGTTMYPAMQDAYTALDATIAKLKHVIILTDGHSSPGDFQGITQRMSSARITVSTVGLGDADQALLEEIAKIGGGRSYFTDDPQSIPQIFARETMSASKSAINEEPFLPQSLRYNAAMAEIDFEQAPFLLGYVVTRAKPTSEVILTSESGDPLLAWWRYGLGRTTAFTSDAKGRWAAEWLAWPGFQRFWAQVARHTMRQQDTRGVVVDVRREGREAVVTLDAVGTTGRYLNDAEARLAVIDPGQDKETFAMNQTAPGRYLARVPIDGRGAYHFELSVSQKGQTVFRQSRGLTVGYADEFRLRPVDDDLLRKLADRTGGRFDPDPKEVFARDERSAARALPLWPYLLIAALLFFVVDVALRRIDFSFGSGRGLTPRRRTAESAKTGAPVGSAAKRVR